MQEVGAMRDAIAMLELVSVGTVLSIAVITASAAFLVQRRAHTRRDPRRQGLLTKRVSWQGWWQCLSLQAC